ncbi:helix-turn-helix domain-containing protein [Russula earlei]|uniref:Helix-turn-helix domain-containing protein n=1 Tax=Russula earlei TaxID=71964 RepID=A0ACC0TSL1_9AGAM|nr:helix-turn-helix domain-containing protein [Russula earlei]
MNLVSNVIGTVKNWWWFIIKGLLFIIAGVAVLTRPLEGYVGLSVLFSLVILGVGLTQVFFALSNTKKLPGWGWTLTSGIIDLAIGFYLLTFPVITMATLPFIVGFWLMFRSFYLMGAAFDLNNLQIPGWGWLLTSGILLLLLSFFVLYYPGAGVAGIIAFSGTAFIVAGIASIDSFILEKYKEVFQQFSRDGIIDMDKRLKHPFGYQVHRLEEVVSKIKGVVPPNRQSVYYITFIQRGTGQKSIGLFNFPIARNTLFVVPQRVIHSTQYYSATCTGYVLNFNIDFFLNNAFPKKLIADKKVFRSSLRPYITVSSAERKKLDTIFEYLLSENAAALQGKNEMIAIKILELLILCDRFFTEGREIKEAANAWHPVIEKFNALIEENFAQKRTVAFYANALGVHQGHLNVIMKTHSGLTAKKAIDNRILLEAKYLLANTNNSIKEIADQLGFADANYFSSFFKNSTKQSPKQYREEVHTKAGRHQAT